MPSVHPIIGALVFAAGFLHQDMCAAQSADPFAVHVREAAAAYELRPASAKDRKLELQAEPILRWTNPVPEKQMRGGVFLWTDDGRPAAVLNVFEMTEASGLQEFHEFCSLAGAALLATGPDNRHWSPADAHIRMSPLPVASAPAPTPRQRLRQMRELAARFTCEKTNRKEETQTLRLLSQPIYRYESKSHDVTDGGLFAFVEATDPEAFLLMEARPVGKTLQWHFGLARMASVHMRASLNSKIVWEVETLPYEEYRNRPDLPYALLLGSQR
jgi:hypothetical protein